MQRLFANFFNNDQNSIYSSNSQLFTLQVTILYIITLFNYLHDQPPKFQESFYVHFGTISLFLIIWPLKSFISHHNSQLDDHFNTT